MADEVKSEGTTAVEETKVEAVNAGAGAEEEDKVVLTQKEYRAIAAYVNAQEQEKAELRRQAAAAKSVPVANAQAVPAAGSPPIDLEEMSKADFAKLVMTAVQDMVKPIYGQMETMRVASEIEKVAAKNADFWEYADGVQKLALANPKMPISQAYKLAKAEGMRTVKPTNDSSMIGELLKRTHSERPSNINAKKMDPFAGISSSRKSAASEAFDKVMQKVK